MLDQMTSTGCGCDDPRHVQNLLDIETATQLAVSLITPVQASETVALHAAIGRVTASEVSATRPMPFFDNAAMDGFALRVADFDRLATFSISATVAAGQVPRPLTPGSAARIFTGAPLPAGADAVIKVEDSSEQGGQVSFHCKTPFAGQNIRRRGSDQKLNERLLRKGQYVQAHHIGLLAAQGVADAHVVRRPRVSVASTGAELGAGSDDDARIFDANRPMLLALAAQAGAEVIDLGIVPDDPDATARTLLAAAQNCDLIVTSGAVSMGGRDHMRGALRQAGGQIDGCRVAVKPGKPVMFGTLGQSVVTGLPGNPFAAFVGFHLFCAVQIARLAGADPQPVLSVPARADFTWTRKPGRAEVFPVRLTGYSAEGLPMLDRLGCSVSATLLPLSGADGLALVDRETDQVNPDDRLWWQPFVTIAQRGVGYGF